MSQIPLIILSKERPKMLRDMVGSILDLTNPRTYRLIICDNCSKQVSMQELLSELEKKGIEIIRNPVNRFFEGLNPALEIVRQQGHRYFIISDPDIMLKPGTPSNWVNDLVDLAEKTTYPKIGLALNMDFPIRTPYSEKVRDLQLVAWQNRVDLPEIDAPCYEAMTDTTMALYRRDTYNYWNENEILFDRNHGITEDGWIDSVKFNYNEKYRGIALRVAGKYTAEHLGFYVDRRYDDDFYYYRYNQDAQAVSSAFSENIIRLLMNDIEKREKMPEDPSVITPELLQQFRLPKDFGANHPAWKQESYKFKWNKMLRYLNNC